MDISQNHNNKVSPFNCTRIISGFLIDTAFKNLPDKTYKLIK